MNYETRIIIIALAIILLAAAAFITRTKEPTEGSSRAVADIILPRGNSLKTEVNVTIFDDDMTKAEMVRFTSESFLRELNSCAEACCSRPTSWTPIYMVIFKRDSDDTIFAQVHGTHKLFADSLSEADFFFEIDGEKIIVR